MTDQGGAETPAFTLRARLRHIALRVWREAISDHIGVVAAGCAFYGMVALFPAISLLVSTYGLLFDVATVEPQIEYLRDLIPEETHDLVTARVGGDVDAFYGWLQRTAPE